MAKTRSEIRTLVQYNTGRSDRTAQINSLCDSALKYAMMEHDFSERSEIVSTDIVITAGATSVDLSTLTPTVFKIVSGAIIQVNGVDAAPLTFKGRVWWGRNVPDVLDEDRGIPAHAMHDGDTILFDCPVDTSCTLRIRYSTIPTFASDSTECPVDILDLFVEFYVTAHVFLSIGAIDKYTFWDAKAIGKNPERPGGELGRAIRTDERETAKTLKSERDGLSTAGTIITKDLDWTESSEHNQYRRFS